MTTEEYLYLAAQARDLQQQLDRERKQNARLLESLHECKNPLMALGETPIGGRLEIGAMVFERVK